MVKITKQEWDNKVLINNSSSYSLVVVLGVLMLWEDKITTREEAEKKLQELELGLSGFQAESILHIFEEYELPDWIDKD